MLTDSTRPSRKRSVRPRERLRAQRGGGDAGRPSPTARSALELRALQGFRMIFGSARSHDVEVRRAAGISGSQLWALSEIARSAGTSVNGLAEHMALHQTTASNLVNSLVARNLIRRTRDSIDQRVVHLHVTKQGKDLLLRAPGPSSGLLVDALRHLEAAQLEHLLKSLTVLVGGIKRTATAAAGETLLGE
jgi:MarR family transcriptional regulator, organic hydroperoxide resistance regulator